MATYTYIRFGQAYGDGNYNTCTYNGVPSCESGTGASNGSLINTGVAVAGIVTLACLIALIAVIVRIWRKPSKPALQEQSVDEDEADNTLPNDPS
jgi:hypothetical protein